MTVLLGNLVLLLLLALAIFVPRPPKCEHTSIRCVHGDEINHLGGARAVCRDCGKQFAELPESCRHGEWPQVSWYLFQFEMYPL